MRRYTVRLLAAGILTGAMQGCTDEAARFPGDPEVGSKYSGAEEAENEVFALYRTGAPAFYGKSSLTGSPVMCVDGLMSGLFDGAPEKEVDMATLAKRIWEDSYQAIYKAGEVIENVPRTKALSGERGDRLVSEACFFRAFNYFYLVRHFGKVPLVDYPERNREVSALPRADISEVYRLIVGDLQTSVRHLPDSAFTENHFRVGRAAAETLLADVYLTMSGYPLRQDNYREAAETARRVIRGGRHRLAPNGESKEESAYNRLRAENRDPEHVYSYQTDRRGGEGTPEASSPPGGEDWDAPEAEGARKAYMPAKEYLNAYDSACDLRMHEHQFFHTFYKRERKGKTVIRTFPRTPYLWFDEGGPRRAGDSHRDIPVYRYAEVLLIAAEAIANAEGVTPEAAGYLAEVRARAYTRTDRAEIISRLSGLGKEMFIREVWLERMREFPLEMKIWTDIQRTRKYPVTSDTDKGSVEFVDVAKAVDPWGTVFEESRLLFPPPINPY